MLDEALDELHAFFDDGYSNEDRKQAWLEANACMGKARLLLQLIEQRRSGEKKSVYGLMGEAREIDPFSPEYRQAAHRLLPPDDPVVIKPN
jgi:hypothetical protein